MKINNEYYNEVEFDGKKFKSPYKSKPLRTAICGANRPANKRFSSLIVDSEKE